MFIKGFWLLVFFLFLFVFGVSGWFLLWMTIEFLGWVFLCFLAKSEDSFFMSISLWKIFFYQFLSSSIFLLSFFLEYNQLYDTPFYSYLFLLSMMMKIGVPPFHGWVVQVSENLPLFGFYFFNFLQKFAPTLIFIHFLNFSGQILFLVILLSLGSVGGWNLFSVHRFLVYSSLMNLSWIISTSYSSKLLFLEYFFCYSLTFWLFFCFFLGENEMKMNYPSYFPVEFNMKLFFLFMIMGIMGVPPTWLFFFKYLNIKYLLMEQNFNLSVFLMIFTVIFMYMYLCLFLCKLFSKLDMFKTMKMKTTLIWGGFFSTCMVFFFNFS